MNLCNKKLLKTIEKMEKECYKEIKSKSVFLSQKNRASSCK